VDRAVERLTARLRPPLPVERSFSFANPADALPTGETLSIDIRQAEDGEAVAGRLSCLRPQTEGSE
jgi:hypothetical protein